mgnify:CR=1 FL=1
MTCVRVCVGVWAGECFRAWAHVHLCVCGFRVQGEWEAPGGVYPNQRLLICTATYQEPAGATADAGSGGKMCGAPVTLSYGSRKAYIAAAVERGNAVRRRLADAHATQTHSKQIESERAKAIKNAHSPYVTPALSPLDFLYTLFPIYISADDFFFRRSECEPSAASYTTCARRQYVALSTCAHGMRREGSRAHLRSLRRLV